MLTGARLPALSPDEAAHTERVTAHIRAEVEAAGGWIPFSRFMQLALYAPGLGYYSAGAHKFGAAGDFVTAPELTPLFARCLASQVAEVLDRTGGGDVLEVGAGSGAMAADLLSALDDRGALPARYRILEVSAELRERQRRALSDRAPRLAGRVEWLDAPPAECWSGAIIGNEVLDALPMEHFRLAGGETWQLGVSCGRDALASEMRPASPQVAAEVHRRLAGLPELPPSGFESEVNLLVRPWIGEMSGRLERGALLFVDYGLPRAQYYHPSRPTGTLTAFFRHRQVGDVLLNPGLQDITAWVDFTEVAEAGAAAGLSVAGFTTQAHFLLSLGLDREVEALGDLLGVAARARISQAVGTLLLPGEMGERFKVIALARGIEGPLAGFAFRDLAASL
jgi:SAM-dependent MidA family methyltransferase